MWNSVNMHVFELFDVDAVLIRFETKKHEWDAVRFDFQLTTSILTE